MVEIRRIQIYKSEEKIFRCYYSNVVERSMHCRTMIPEPNYSIFCFRLSCGIIILSMKYIKCTMGHKNLVSGLTVSDVLSGLVERSRM